MNVWVDIAAPLAGFILGAALGYAEKLLLSARRCRYCGRVSQSSICIRCSEL